ncbi:MAG: lysine--tRNA ligase, partial [Caldilineaceae bacterium]|nr:lysine--tRNA ligase [Caldilineaceae bacterium]
MFDQANLSDQEQARLRNLQTLVDAGIEPYPARVQRTHTIAQARALHEAQPSTNAQEAERLTVTVTGRLKRIRVMGKMSFADLEDGTGQIQIVLRRDDLPDDWYNTIWKKAIDLGDFIGVSGPLVVTKTGELSVEAHNVQFLSKALKPMPDKWHGVR